MSMRSCFNLLMYSYVFSTSAFLGEFSDENASYSCMSPCRNRNSEERVVCKRCFSKISCSLDSILFTLFSFPELTCCIKSFISSHSLWIFFNLLPLISWKYYFLFRWVSFLFLVTPNPFSLDPKTSCPSS